MELHEIQRRANGHQLAGLGAHIRVTIHGSSTVHCSAAVAALAAPADPDPARLRGRSSARPDEGRPWHTAARGLARPASTHGGHGVARPREGQPRRTAAGEERWDFAWLLDSFRSIAAPPRPAMEELQIVEVDDARCPAHPPPTSDTFLRKKQSQKECLGT
ncbi:unnamed protein product [Urochloa humidicola]